MRIDPVADDTEGGVAIELAALAYDATALAVMSLQQAGGTKSPYAESYRKGLEWLKTDGRVESILNHTPMGRLGDAPELIGQYFEEPDVDALDTTCLDTLSYVPPFLHFNGWSP